MTTKLPIILLGAFVAIGCERKTGWVEPRHAEAQPQKITCGNNLKQLGLTFKVWAGDNGGSYPFNVGTNEGGTMELCMVDLDGFDSNTPLHFQAMSNELTAPQILVCPRDSSRKPATNCASLGIENITYRLRTGSNVREANPKEVLLLCPIDGNVLRCDGTVESKAGEVEFGGVPRLSRP